MASLDGRISRKVSGARQTGTFEQDKVLPSDGHTATAL